MTHRTTLVIADDHPLVLYGLAELIRLEPEFYILAVCADGVDAIARIRDLTPDMAVLDLNMPGKSGLEILREIRADALSTRIVLLTAGISDSEIMSAVSSGVDGLLLKNAAPDTLIDCLRNVAAGGAWLPTTTVGAAIDREADRGKRAHQILDPLTVRERQIVRFACLAMPNKSIAKELKIAEGTVKIHLNNAYMKLDVKSRAELRKKLNLILDLEFDN